MRRQATAAHARLWIIKQMSRAAARATESFWQAAQAPLAHGGS
jgi:hypothetical protein